MIIALLTWLFKKYAMPAISRYKGNRTLKTIRNTAALVILLATHTSVFAQEQTTKYNVLHSGKVVGRLDLYQKRDGENLYLRMISEVKMRFIFSIRVNCNEESSFQNGRLISSHVLRNVNGKQKANRQTTALGDSYQTVAEGKGGTVNQKDISTNLMLLYTHEPADNAQVYSDNFQQFLKVKQTGNHIYRIDLPDGNYNYYSYTNGVCSKVDIHHSLYTIQIELA
ncbi:hypothetical protein IDJ77_17040 [Mucilaginibacter sp. ZT4R22]|uniref:Uncharacterized protein n=1 Tax=Mucilaginibacter pankratovii TaxID=2772110 RepID=A0ABR7WVS5_9SPHI|nr:DUF6134 family protein [Mucilaginibacter pankratovii]MBD1365524.1 hypothetical protein [Mucilaginibacter pankratovii]